MMTTYRQLREQQPQQEFTAWIAALIWALQSRTWTQTLWFIKTCLYLDDIKDNEDPGALSQKCMHGITLRDTGTPVKHEYTCNTTWSKITGTYTVRNIQRHCDQWNQTDLMKCTLNLPPWDPSTVEIMEWKQSQLYSQDFMKWECSQLHNKNMRQRWDEYNEHKFMSGTKTWQEQTAWHSKTIS